MSDVDKWIEIAKRCKYLPEDDLRELCNIVCDLLLEEPNVQPVQTPVTVCGDIHGQLIDETVLCVHGGLSPEISMLDQIRCIDRNQQIPHKGAFCDLLWSDPADVKMWSVSPRGAGWLFGSYVTELFMNYNNLNLICRAHQLVNEGYKYMFDKRLVTVWSAPNYCYRCGNVASILEFNTVNDRTAKLFQAVPDSEREVPPQHTTPYFL
uniref:protein-serine/threonine phosphatase n=1 Tax=Heliothis virescens TaxID=7102 RepID=A0A2A4K668_HELVI